MPLASPSQPPGYHPFKQEIIRMVREYDASRPRSLQMHLGPSEIGAGCARQLAFKLAGKPGINQSADPWFPIIGTAVHAWLAVAVQWYNDTVLKRANDPRFLVESRVRVAAAHELAYDTAGSTDVYDVDYERVIDWKIVGTTTMRKVKNEGSTQQYRIQGMTYGKGWVQAGYPVREVLICYLPRSNFLTNMYIDTLPFDPTLADVAQQRVGTIEAMVRAGVAPESFPASDCTIWCPFYAPKVDLGHSSCPGHGSVKDD